LGQIPSKILSLLQDKETHPSVWRLPGSKETGKIEISESPSVYNADGHKAIVLSGNLTTQIT
jgi:hypothetical protein